MSSSVRVSLRTAVAVAMTASPFHRDDAQRLGGVSALCWVDAGGHALSRSIDRAKCLVVRKGCLISPNRRLPLCDVLLIQVLAQMRREQRQLLLVGLSRPIPDLLAPRPPPSGRTSRSSASSTSLTSRVGHHATPSAPVRSGASSCTG